MRKHKKQQTSDTALTDEELIEKYGDEPVAFKERITVAIRAQLPHGGRQQVIRKKKKKDK